MSNAFDSDNQRDNEKRKFQADSSGDVSVNVKSNNMEALLSDIATNTGGSAVNQETLQGSGSVGLTPVQFPSTPGFDLIAVYIQCRVQFPSTKRLLYSFDGGVTYSELAPGGAVAWEPKDIQQVFLQGNAPGVFYDILVNRREV
jgi:hypothetical protein